MNYQRLAGKPSFHLERRNAWHRVAYGHRVNGKSYRWRPIEVQVTPLVAGFGFLYIGDPAYPTFVPNQSTARIPVLAGCYEVRAEVGDVGGWGTRVVGLALKRCETRVGALDPKPYASFGVDTATAWILDGARVPSAERTFDVWSKSAFGAAAYPWPTAALPAPFGRRGVVTPTGLGDGEYDIFVARNGEGVIAMVVLDFSVSFGEALFSRSAHGAQPHSGGERRRTDPCGAVDRGDDADP